MLFYCELDILCMSTKSSEICSFFATVLFATNNMRWILKMKLNNPGFGLEIDGPTPKSLFAIIIITQSYISQNHHKLILPEHWTYEVYLVVNIGRLYTIINKTIIFEYYSFKYTFVMLVYSVIKYAFSITVTSMLFAGR